MGAVATSDIWYDETPNQGVSPIMSKPIDLTFDDISQWLRYVPETGQIFWRKSPSRRIKAGSEAGSVKRTKPRANGIAIQYRYIRVTFIETPAGRIAWLLHHGEWPEHNVLFKDGNTLNLRAENLMPGKFPSIKVDTNGRRSHKMSKAAQRHYGLRRYYGLTGEQYGAMVAAQEGVCAICKKPETAVANGNIKPLSVDHNHETGAIRSLLCSSCNHMLGHARESRDTLIAAIRYLDRHAGSTTAPVMALVVGGKDFRAHTQSDNGEGQE